MAQYNFITTWTVNAPIDQVWDLVLDSLHWPQWWSAVQDVQELTRGDDNGVGSVRRYRWKSFLPYTLSFNVTVTRVERQVAIDGVSVGELEGSGRWTFRWQEPTTTVQYEWRVSTTNLWMNLLEPFVRPIFAWNHDYAMKQGATGLARRLNAEVTTRSETGDTRRRHVLPAALVVAGLWIGWRFLRRLLSRGRT